MKTLFVKTTLIFLSLLLVSTKLYSQYPRYINIFNYSTDARQAAMGGDSQGSLDGPSYIFPIREIMSNNTILSSFSIRPPNWNSADFLPFHTIGIQKDFDSSITAGAYIARNTSGIQIPISQNVSTFHGNVEPYQLYAVGFVNFLVDEDLSIGLAGKLYSGNNSPFILIGYSQSGEGRVQGTAYMADIAIQKRFTLINELNERKIIFLRAGLSNLGTWIRYTDDLIFQVPRSFHIDVILYKQFELYSLMYNGHTRMVLNAVSDDERYYVNTGMEAGYKNILFGRVGMFLNPYASLFGSKNSPRFTFGLGLKLKNHSVSERSRFQLTFDFAAVPLTKADYPTLILRENTFNYIFSTSLIYPISWSEPF
ncbi:MAG TPA: hypothetical protein DCQ28_11125 [Bacteroidetes bacterium]|nr:hypothetical protein [Bacteroidota bacterium]